MAMSTDNNESTNADQPPNKRRRKKSMVWEYFSVKKIDAGCTRAYCNQCNKSFAYLSGSTLAGTSHLKRHITNGSCSDGHRKYQERNQLTIYTPLKTDGTAVGTIPPRKRCRSMPRTSIPSYQASSSHAIAKMIILHEYPPNIVEHCGFAEFIRCLHPKFHINVNSVEEECINIYLREKQDVMNYLGGMLGHVNLALDLWTSHQGLCYLLLTGYFIDSNWKLQKRILNVAMLPFPDKDDAFSHAVLACLFDWGLESKMFTVTLDQSLGDEAVRRNLRDLLSVKNPESLNGQLILGNCYARILSCLAKEALDSMKDIIKKVRDGVKYVKTYRGNEEKFIELKQRLQNSSSKTLNIDDQTKWNTTYHMLVAASELKEVFSCLDTSDPYFKETLSIEEWRQVEILCIYLKFFFDAANVLLAPTHPTTNLFYHEVSNIQLELSHATNSQDAFISNLTKPLLEKFNEYWNTCNLLFAVAVVMDPRFKMKLVEFSFHKIYGEYAEPWIKVVEDGIQELFVEYIVLSLPPPTFVVQENDGLKVEMTSDDLSAADYLSDFDICISEIAGSEHMKSELDQYLEEPILPRTQDFDVLSWWKLNASKYPTLSKMACDILCIPVSTVAPDSVFDTEPKKMDSYRCSLKPVTVEALICAKDWLQCGSSTSSIPTFKMGRILQRKLMTFSHIITSTLKSKAISKSHAYRCLKVHFHHFYEPSFPSLFVNCNSMDQLKQVHLQAIQMGLSSDPAVFSKLITFCSVHESGSMDYARQVFDTILEPNIFIWNTMIKGYSRLRNPKLAVSVYMEMLESNVKPDNYTYPFLLKCFTPCIALNCGRQIHGHVCKFGFESNVAVQHVLIHMYSLSKQLDIARGVFDMTSKSDVLLWNAMISGYNRIKKFDESKKLFDLMEKRRVKPSTVTLIIVLAACSKLKDLDMGKRVHQCIKDHKVESTLTLENTLVDTYAACGELDVALEIFENMKKRDVRSWTSIVTGFLNIKKVDLAREYFDHMPNKDSISWTAMIDGYLKLNRFKEVLMLFREMQTTKVEADAFTMVSVLTACAHLGALELGDWIKAYIDKKNIKIDAYVGNALIDMYFRCGDVQKAMEIFNYVQHRDKFTYTATIVGFASNGCGKEALDVFDQMLRASVRPDEIACIGVLCACTHSGLVNEGREFFASMTNMHGIEPNVAHYGCLVDLLGRAGHLREAYEVIKNMPIRPNSLVWGALLGACKVCKDVEMAEIAARQLLQLEPGNESVYVLLCNIYVVCNRLENLRALRKLMTDRGIRKTPGCSSIEVNGIVHEFVAGDRSHPEAEHIYSQLENLKGILKFAGFALDTSEVFL